MPQPARIPVVRRRSRVAPRAVRLLTGWLVALAGACSEHAGDSAGGGNAGDVGDVAATRLDCVDITNAYRQQAGVSAALTRWTAQESCADSEAKSDSESGTAHGAFGACGEMAQNECPGWPGDVADVLDSCLAQMFAEGPGQPYAEHGHYINMTSTQYTRLACGFHRTPGGKWWIVQDFR